MMALFGRDTSRSGWRVGAILLGLLGMGLLIVTGLALLVELQTAPAFHRTVAEGRVAETSWTVRATVAEGQLCLVGQIAQGSSAGSCAEAAPPRDPIGFASVLAPGPADAPLMIVGLVRDDVGRVVLELPRGHRIEATVASLAGDGLQASTFAAAVPAAADRPALVIALDQDGTEIGRGELADD
jgi:hypothetical protein